MSVNKSKLIISSAYAAIITTIFVVVITIWAELSAPLKDWLKNFSGHHWVSKSIFSALLYVSVAALLYALPRQYNENSTGKIIYFLLAFLMLGVAAIALFFTGHHFQIF